VTARIIPVESFDLVVFGGTGDLACRKLLPALYYRDRDRQMPDDSQIIGVARSEIDRDGYLAQIGAALRRYVAAEDLDETCLKRFLDRLDYFALDALGERGWDLLAATLQDPERIRVFYLATAPDLFGPICRRLASSGLVTAETRAVLEKPIGRAETRAVLEKPIGRDLTSARAVNQDVGAVLAENQIFRIDHYLGKETVQNLMALRFANSLIEPLWNRAHVDHVQITVAETIGVEGRGPYYDKAGALRDMVQNHMVQLLCLVAMESPTLLTADAVRDEKLKVLRALKPISGQDVDQKTVRGQYRAGAIDGAPGRSAPRIA
jgi:glucose-6-phosphate 1-dehydrogenase